MTFAWGSGVVVERLVQYEVDRAILNLNPLILGRRVQDWVLLCYPIDLALYGMSNSLATSNPHLIATNNIDRYGVAVVWILIVARNKRCGKEEYC
jgi:hypothetical protein